MMVVELRNVVFRTVDRMLIGGRVHACSGESCAGWL
jgi:hypothetical protein